jgi:hypothetical protein
MNSPDTEFAEIRIDFGNFNDLTGEAIDRELIISKPLTQHNL